MRCNLPIGLTVALLLSSGSDAQKQEDPITKFHNLGLKSIDGPIPLLYSPSAEQRALRYHKSFSEAVAFFSEQLKIQLPIVMIVASRQHWEKGTTPPYPLPHAHWFQKPTGGWQYFTVLPERIEEFPFSADMAKDPDLLAEAISFHEAGHLFSHALGIGSRNPWVSELIANFFMVGYIRNGHPQYSFMTAGPPASMSQPRYRKLADLDYLYADVGMANYAWFQFRLHSLAHRAALGDIAFADLIARVKSAFPASDAGTLSVEHAFERLEMIQPGMTTIAQDLKGPSTIDRTALVECGEPTPRGGPAVLVIRNDTGRAVAVQLDEMPQTQIPGSAFRKFQATSGSHVRVADSGCLEFGPTPRLAILSASDSRAQPK